MSAKAKEQGIVEPRVTIDELKHRAESLKSQAVDQAKDVADTVMRQDATRVLAAVAGVVIVAASLAYFVGTRSGRAAFAERAANE